MSLCFLNGKSVSIYGSFPGQWKCYPLEFPWYCISSLSPELMWSFVSFIDDKRKTWDSCEMFVLWMSRLACAASRISCLYTWPLHTKQWIDLRPEQSSIQCMVHSAGIHVCAWTRHTHTHTPFIYLWSLSSFFFFQFQCVIITCLETGKFYRKSCIERHCTNSSTTS